MARIAVLGAGAIGLVLADAASAVGNEVVLCGRHAPERITIIDHRGAIAESHLEVWKEPGAASSVDLILLAVKRQDSSVLDEWSSLFGSETSLLAAQNGLVRSEMISSVPSSAAVVEFGAVRIAPGVVQRTGGDMVRIPARFAWSVSLFDSNRVRVEPDADFDRAQWRKAAINVCAGGLTALHGRGFGIFRDPFVRVVAQSLLAEAAMVAASAGVELGEGFVEEVLADLSGRPVDGTTSLLRDLRAERPLELDAHGGDIREEARRRNVDIPLIDHLLDALGDRGAGCRETIR